MNKNEKVVPIGLKAFFSTHGMSQKEIAAQLGVSQAAVSALLNGKSFGKNLAKKWSNIFGFNPNWLITGEGEMLNLTKNKSTVKEITEENRYNSSDYISLQKDLISAQAKIITLNEELQELRQELLVYLKNKPSKSSTSNDDVFLRSARKTGV